MTQVVGEQQEQPASQATFDTPSIENHNHPNHDFDILKTVTHDIVESSPALFYSYKMNHVTGASSFPFVSKYCEDLLGVSAKEVMEDPAAMVNLVHPDDIEIFTNGVVQINDKLNNV